MVRHVVLFTWKAGTTAEQIAAAAAGLRSLPAQISSIKAYTCGSDLSLGEPRWDFAIVADFDDADGWRDYDQHAAHDEVRQHLVTPLVETRASVQFDL